MVTPVKIKALPASTMKFKAVTSLPGRIVGGTGITAAFSNGIWTISVDTSGVTWQGAVIAPAFGGTGIANANASTITLGGALVTSGAFPLTLTATAATNVTLPTTGTLATLAGSEAFTNKTISGATNTVDLSAIAAQAAYTFVGNNTSGSARPTAVDIALLTTKDTPTAADYLMLSDQAAGGAWKKVVLSSVATLPAPRLKLAAATNFYVRSTPANCTISIASPGVVTKTAHGLSANDPVIFAILPQQTAAITVSIASPAVVGWFLHSFSAGQPFKFSTTNGALPTGITAGTTYYVIAAGLTAGVSFQFSATLGGAAVNTSGTQSGSHFGELTGAMPTGLLADGTNYYVKTVTGADTFTVSATPGGAVINTTGSTTGTISYTTGSNSNGGLSPTRNGAFLTLQGAYDYISQVYDLAGFTATVNAAASVYNSGLLVLGTAGPHGSGASSSTGIQFLGDITTPGNCLISTSGICIAASFGGAITHSGFKVVSSTSKGMYAAAQGRINVTGNMEFGACADMGAHANVDGVIVFNTGFRVSGGGNGLLYSSKCSTIEMNTSTVTLVNTPTYITTATAIDEAMLSVPGVTWTGLATGQRYNADCAKINTGAAGITYFPGNSAGVCVNGGVYDSGLLSSITASLGADVALNNTGTYFDGPSVAQGTVGTWFVFGKVTVSDTVAPSGINCKLWDGTTVIDSTRIRPAVATAPETATLSGVITSPAGNLRISCNDATTTTGVIQFNTSGNSKDSTITAVRIA